MNTFIVQKDYILNVVFFIYTLSINKNGGH